MSDAKTDSRIRQGKRKRRLVSFGVFVLLLGTLFFGALAMMGRPISAPDWLRGKIEARIDESLPGIKINFGQMSLEVNRQGQPRVILWDVDIRNALGEQVAALADIEAGFSPLALLRGELALQSAQVSGAFVTLQRDAEGRFGLALGDVFSAGTKSPDLPEILARVDELMIDPRLAELDLFEADALTIRYEDIRARRGWTADGGRLRLTRAAGKLQFSGDVALLAGGDSVATMEMNAESPLGEPTLDFGLKLGGLWSRDIATQSPAMAWLDVVEAPISGALRSGLDARGALRPLNATLQIGQGVLRPNRDIKPLPFDSARTYFTYRPDKAQLSFDEISVSSPLLQAHAEGKAVLHGLDKGWPTALTAQFSLPRIYLEQSPVLDREIKINGAEAAFKLTFDPFQVSLGELRLTDPELPVRASGLLSAFSDGWDIALDAEVAEATPEQILAYWPAKEGVKTKDWLAENLLGGRAHDAVYALRVTPGEKPRHFVDLRFSDGQLRYARGLPPIKGASGRLVIHEGRLGIQVDRAFSTPGKGGDIDLSGSQFVIPDLKEKPARGIVTLSAASSVTAALSYVDNDVWQVLRKAGQGVDMATGRAELAGEIEVPLIKGVRLDDIGLSLNGILRSVESAALVKGHKLAGARLDLALNNEAVEISGPVTLSGIPARGNWRQPLGGGAGRVVADVTVTQKALDTFGIDLPRGMVRGKGTGRLQLSLVKGATPEFTFESNLAGIGLAVPELGWRLPEASRGKFRVAGRFGAPVSIDSLSVSGAGLEAAGALSLTGAGALNRVTLSRLKIGNWLDVRAILKGRGRGLSPTIEVTSGRADLRGAPFGGTTSAAGGGAGGVGQGAPIALTLDRLQVTDAIWIGKFRGNFETGQGLAGRFDGQLGGSTPISGRVKPKNGGTGFVIRGEDAGDILKAAGILKTVRNGTFKLDLTPVRNKPGRYNGLLQITETRLRNAPAIGALLDAVSIVGLLDQLNGPGIFFAEVEARFRLTPSRIVITQSSAVGPSMGISMDGYYDLAQGTMDMQGVVSPIYILNGIGRLIARKGEGLIGFNFNLKGPVSGPAVSVNPLSVFTPGMFRDIFRRPPPQVSE